MTRSHAEAFLFHFGVFFFVWTNSFCSGFVFNNPATSWRRRRTSKVSSGQMTDKELEQSGRLLWNALNDPAGTNTSSSRWIPLSIPGMTAIPRLGRAESIVCALVGNYDSTTTTLDTTIQCLPVPNCQGLERSSFSRLQLLLGNGKIVNRDNGIFDNLPYTEWTAFGPRDAAGQPSTYHWGKRQFYNRFMGRDWYKYSATRRTSVEPPKEEDIVVANDAMLQYRINEIFLRDVQMSIAECDSEIAILTRMAAQDEALLEQWKARRLEFTGEENKIQRRLEELKQTMDPRNPSKRLEDILTDASKVDVVDGDEMSFENPFNMLQSLVKEMLKADVVAVFLEDISWSSSVVLGGGIVLQRQTVKDTISLAGERVQVTNEKETFGSDTVNPGELYVLDCHADEAVQLSSACGIALWCQASLLEAGKMPFRRSAESPYGSLAGWKPVDESTVLSVQGRPLDHNGTIAKVQLDFDSLSRWEQATGGTTTKQVFPTENPIESLSEYDELSDAEKVRLLMALGDNDMRIPRPRTIRNQPDRLDELLMPRVDEVVRTQWRLREVERSGGDMNSISKSQRFVAKENAQKARDAGEDEIAEWWENEAELFSSLKADLTQDEGSYSRFLDKDEWYERERQQAAERARKQFGDLGLD